MLWGRGANGKYFPSHSRRCQLSPLASPSAAMKSPSALSSASSQDQAPAANAGAASGQSVGEGLDSASGGNPDGLREKVYKGAAWVMLASLLTQGLNLVRLVALTRLLSPSDFGLATLMLTVISGLGLLTNLGMGAVIITRRFEDEAELHRYMNTAWSFEIARNLIFSILLCVAAFPVAKFMGQPALGPLLLASAPAPFIYSLNNIGLMLFRRDVNIARITQFDSICGVASVILSIAFAWAMRSVWAIVVANFVFSFFLVALSYRFHPYRPRLAFDREALRVGFRFGQSVFVGGLMAYIGTTADNMVVGKMLGTVTLAAYAAAFGVATLPQKVVAGLLGTILFPSFAAASRAGGEQVEKIVTRAFMLGCSLMSLLVLPLFVLAPEVLAIFGDKQYQEAVPLLRIMLIGNLFRSLTQVLSPMTHGLGHPEIDAKSATAEAIVFVTLLFVLTSRLGATGAAWSGVIAYGLSFGLRCFWSRALAPRAISSLPLTLALTLLCAGGGWGAAVYVLSLPALVEASVWTRAVVGGTVSLSVAVVELAIVFPSLSDEFTQIVAMLKKRVGG